MDTMNQDKFDELYELIQRETKLNDEELEEILKEYDIETLEEKIVIYTDYSIYEYNDKTDLGKQLFEIYESYAIYEHNIPQSFIDYFDFEAYAINYINTMDDLVELSDNKLIVLY